MSKISFLFWIKLFIYWVVASLFVWFAWVQRNDIDNIIYHQPSSLDVAIWFLFYLAIGLPFFVLSWWRPPWQYQVFLLMFAVIQLIISSSGFITNLTNQQFILQQKSMSASTPYIEQSREFFGALIGLIAIVSMYYCGRQKPAKKK